MNFLTSLLGNIKRRIQSDNDICSDYSHSMRSRLGSTDAYMAIVLAHAALIREGRLSSGLTKWILLRNTGIDKTSILDPENEVYFDAPAHKEQFAISERCLAYAAQLREHPVAKSNNGRDVCSLTADGLQLLSHGFKSRYLHAISNDKSWTRIDDPFSNYYSLFVVHRGEQQEERIEELRMEAERFDLGFAKEIPLAWEIRIMHTFYNG